MRTLETAISLFEAENPKLIAIVGPTATGKSDLAINFGKYVAKKGGKCEIVNADSYAQYREMDIGTAKVSFEEREELEKQFGIRHYMIDNLEVEEEATVFEYKNMAKKIVENGINNGKTMILCGGSGLYVKSVIDDLEFQNVDLEYRKEIEKEWDEDLGETLWRELEKKDPKTALSLQKENKRRVVRAIEVIRTTGEKFASQLPKNEYSFEKTLQIGLKSDLQKLDERIEKRTLKMRELGLKQEVEKLQNRLGKTASKAIGYAELLQFFRNEINPANQKIMTEDAAFEQISQHTKRLVRRQISWFKRDERIEWIEV